MLHRDIVPEHECDGQLIELPTTPLLCPTCLVLFVRDGIHLSAGLRLARQTAQSIVGVARPVPGLRVALPTRDAPIGRARRFTNRR
jgi:hypothetical protein